MMERLGYLHPAYAASLAEFGTPQRLEASDGWLLERRIPNSDAHDAMGCYPLFAVVRWQDLAGDLERLATRLVSVTVVCDPFGAHTPELLAQVFDVVRPFKHHVVVDLQGFSPSRHHRRCARAALCQMRVEEVSQPRTICREWCVLYEGLARRHRLDGIKAFSSTAFAMQLSVPGIRVFRATVGDEIVGAHLWYVSNGVAYSHLHAISERGYELGASYALYEQALEGLASCADHADLGAGAGVEGDGGGLSWFKRGWSAESRTVYLCGRILNPVWYRHLAARNGGESLQYFPAYRGGEFLGLPARAHT